MFTRAQIELALSEGRLFAKMGNGNYWRLRRNGATQLWKTRPSEFRIPVKAGLKAYGQVWHSDTIGVGRGSGENFVIMAESE